MSTKELTMLNRPGRIALLALLGGLACDRPAQTRESEGERRLGIETSALMAAYPTFQNCTLAEETKLRAAWDVLAPQILQEPGKSKLLECLKEGFLQGVEHEHGYPSEDYQNAYPEWSMKLMAAAVPTTIFCADTSKALATTSETVQIARSNIADETNEGLAGKIAHEISHTKGLMHHTYGTLDVVYSVPGRFEACVAAVYTNWDFRLRSTLPNETLLAPVGIEQGGLAYPGETFDDVLCPDQRFAAGLNLSGGPSTPIRGVGLICKPSLVDTADIKTPFSTPWAPTPTAYRCPDSQVLVGAWGWADERLKYLAPLCAREIDVRSDGTAATAPAGQGVLGQGESWRRQCPAGMALKGIRGLSDGTDVTRIELKCQRLVSPETIKVSYAQRVGNGLPWLQQRGNGREILRSLETKADSTVRRISGRINSLPKPGDPVVIASYLLPGLGAVMDGVGVSYEDFCPASYALVGVQSFTGSQPWEPIQGIRGICASLSSWSSRTVLPWRGTSTGSGFLQTSFCPANQYVIGWGASPYDAVYGVQPICRDYVNPEIPAMAGYQRVEVTSALNTVSLKQSYPVCPAGKQVVGAGWIARDAADQPIDSQVPRFFIPQLAYSIGPPASALMNVEGPGSSWKLTGQVTCVNTATAGGIDGASTYSPVDTTAVKEITAFCPAGKAIAAGWGVLDSTKAMLDGKANAFLPTDDGRGWRVIATPKQTFSDPSWQLNLRLVCAPESSLPGYNRVVGESALDGSSIKEVTVTCPNGGSPLGSGWAFYDGGGNLLDGEAIYSLASATGWTVRAKSTGSTRLRVIGYCATATP